MKKIFPSILFILLVVGLQAQVGINTVNPKGTLHIDGASTAATTNPATGAVTAAQAADDVIINSSGNVAVGHLSPWGKLHIVSPTVGKALRIRDGGGKLKLLVSGSVTQPGSAFWNGVQKAWSAGLFNAAELPVTTKEGYRQYFNFADGFISSPTMGAIDKVNGQIKVPADGLYRITMSAYFECNRNTGERYKIGLILGVGINRVWEGIILGQTDLALFPTSTVVRPLKKDEIITMATNESDKSFANLSRKGLLLVELLQQY